MDETPDFEREAQAVAALLASGVVDEADVITTALRRMWNARGATDIALVDRELSSMMGSNKAGPYVKNLDRALRALDR